MDDIGAQVGQKVRSAVKAKLLELGAHVDDDLPNYVMIMVANKRTKSQMDNELRLFLGSNTDMFTTWLHEVLKKLQEVKLNNANVEAHKMSEVNKGGEDSRDEKKKKRKPSTSEHSEDQKEKKRKLDTKHKTGKGGADTLKEDKYEVSRVNALVEMQKEVAVIPLKHIEMSTAKNTVGQKMSSAEMFKLESVNPWDSDDDEDFINLKADTETGDLLDTELLNEPTKELPKKSVKVAAAPLRSIPSESFSPRIITLNESSQKPSEKTKGKLYSRSSHAQKTLISIRSELEKQRDRDAKQQQSRPHTVSKDIQERKPIENRLRLASRVGAVVHRPVEEDEEYDPSNPAVGNVASVVRVKARPHVPADKQANKNLLLKAMAEAHKSVQTRKATKPPEDVKRPLALFTKKYKERQHNDRHDEDIRAYTSGRVGKERPLRLRHQIGKLQNIIVSMTVEQPKKLPSKVNHSEKSESSEKERIVQEVEDSAAVHAQSTESDVENTTLYDDGSNDTEDLVKCATEPVAKDSPPVSPQFVVTLDGFDPEYFPEQTQVDDKTHEKIKSEEAVNKSTVAEDDLSDEQKKNERCKFWPNCNQGEKCIYHHPCTPCKTFPNCQFGDKCLYIHPNCKYDLHCTRASCPFTHVSRRPLVPSQQVPSKTIQCRYYPRCSILNCPFYHPKACKFGSVCTRSDCAFGHSPLPSKSQLKWVAPSKS